MADRNATSSALARPIWMKQAEEAKLKSEAEKAAAAKAAFDATFKDVSKKEPASPDSDADEAEDLTDKPIGPVDPSKCTAAGAGIGGGAACTTSSFVVFTKDSDGRKIPNGGAVLKVKISPAVGVGGSELEGVVKDQGDGSYTVSYVVPTRGNYMVYVECNGKPIMGSPFPVFFSTGSTGGGILGMTPSPFPNMVNQTMPNMPNYAGSVSGAFPSLLGMIPGSIPGETGGVLLPGIGSSFGEVCREYLNQRCMKTDCKFNHPPKHLLVNILAPTTSMGSLSQVPMAPSAAAMAAAQAIVAAQALQSQIQAQNKASKDSSGLPDAAGKADALKRTLQVSNLSPLLQGEHLKQLFSYCGTVVDCSITESKHFAYIEYSKEEETVAALALNNIDVGGRPLNVEMAKSLPSKPASLNSSLGQSSLPMVMQQAVAMQQLQFQQSLLMQQTMNAQQAANRAATMKSATELASARAAEISKKLKADGVVTEDKDANRNSRSPDTSRARSKSKSRSPVKYRRSRRSRSFSPAPRYTRDRRSRSPFRSRHQTDFGSKRRSYKEVRDYNERSERRERERSHDRYSSASRRNKRSVSPRTRKTSRMDSISPKRRRESLSPRARKSSRRSSRSPRRTHESRSSPRHTHESRSSPRRTHESRSSPRRTHESRSPSRWNHVGTSHHRRRSRSKSVEDRPRSDGRRDGNKYERSKVDAKSSEKIRDAPEKRQRTSKDSKTLTEDVDSDSSPPTRQKSSLDYETTKDGRDRSKHKTSVSLEDETIRDGRDRSKHKTAMLDDKDLSRHVDNAKDEIMNLREDKRSGENRAYPKDKDLSRKREKADSSRGGNSSEKERAHTGSDDLSKRGRSDSDYKRHEKGESVRRKGDSRDDDSTYIREGRRTLDNSKSSSDRNSLKHQEDAKGVKDQSRSDKMKIEETDKVVVGGDLSEPTHDSSLFSPKPKYQSSFFTENGASKDLHNFSRHEEFRTGSKSPEKTGSMTKKEKYDDFCLEDGGHDATVADESKELEYNVQPVGTSPVPNKHYYVQEGSMDDERVPYFTNLQLDQVDSIINDEDGADFSDLITCGPSSPDSRRFDVVKDQNRLKNSTLEDGDVVKTAWSNDEDFLDGDSTHLREDMTAGSSILKAHNGNSASPLVDRSDNPSRGTGDIYPTYTLENGSFPDSLVSSAGDYGEYDLYDKIEQM